MAVADNRFDRERVADEIEDLGKSECDTVRSQVDRIIEHLLKLQFSPADQPRLGWMRSITDARRILGDKLSPTLRRDIETRLATLYEDARYATELALSEFGEERAAEGLPPECPYTLEQVLEKRWYPKPMEKP